MPTIRLPSGEVVEYTRIGGTAQNPVYYNDPVPKPTQGTPISGSFEDVNQYGAAGRGEFMDENAADTEQAGDFGVPMSEVGEYQTDPNYRIPATLTGEESVGIANKYGFAGMSKGNEYAGLTRREAEARAKQKQEKLMKTTSQRTSYAFNPETISGFNNKFGELRFKIDSINSDPWMSSEEKKVKGQALIKSYDDQFASLFQSPGDFYNSMQNPDFQNAVQQFRSLGGDPNSIASKIGKGTVSVVGETPNPDGTFNVQYSDGTSDVRRYSTNQDGIQTSNEAQTLEQYLGALKTPSEKRAFESLIPEQKAYQERIAMEQSIPEKYKELYFGTPEKIGFLQQKRQQAEEEIKILDRKAEMDKANTQAQLAYTVDKNNLEMEIEDAQIQENLETAKNYMTGMLAKLGALNTTGAAPLALATLDQKYKTQSKNLRSKYSIFNRGLQLKMSEQIDGINIKRDQDILKTRSDLSKGEEDVLKEVFKLQNEADRETLSIVDKYASEFRSQKDKYTLEAKREAEKYAKQFAKTVGKYTPNDLNFENFIKYNESGQGRSGNVLGNVIQAGGSSFDTNERKKLVPDFFQGLISGGKVSDELNAVISGEKDIKTYTPAVQAKIQKEMTKLGIKKDMLAGTTSAVPPVGDLLREAKAAIAAGKDKQAVKQKFLEAYPEKSSTWNAYFKK